MKGSCTRQCTLSRIFAGTLILACIFRLGVFLASAAENVPDCDIQSGPCVKETNDGMRVEFDVLPKPVAALSERMFIVTVSRGGSAVSDASVVLDLSMPGMFMGKNQPAMKQTGSGRYEGKGVIIKCASGRRTWRADISIAHGGKNAVTSFVFEVK